MDIIKKEYKYRSYSDLGDIYARAWMPSNPEEVKGIIQLAHGMAEHGERYEGFAKFLCQNGYAVYVNDHIGHGKSVSEKAPKGYFGEKSGWISFVEDAHLLTGIAKSEYPDVPLYFFGHSMGSFVARSYIRKYGDDVKKAIICGTSGSNPATGAGILITKIIAKIRGSLYLSNFINNLAFGSYNKKFKPNRTEFDWLTRDEKIVDKYIDDPDCGFLFTTRGYIDMFSILADVSKEAWYKSIRKDLPVFLISGSMDPVGNYGKGVTEVCEKLKAAGVKDVSMKLYVDSRHEIHNDMDKNTVYNDVLNWIEK